MTSEAFEMAFCSGTSGCVRTCECGVTYFDEDDTTIDWENGELEGLKENSKKNPEMFRGCDYSIPTFIVSGKEFVFGCQCDGADMYENFINYHDTQIAEYLNKKAESLRGKADNIEVKK